MSSCPPGAAPLLLCDLGGPFCDLGGPFCGDGGDPAGGVVGFGPGLPAEGGAAGPVEPADGASVTDAGLPAAVVGFPAAAVDGFPAAAVDGFPAADVDGFPAAGVDGFPAAGVVGFPAAGVFELPAACVGGGPDGAGVPADGCAGPGVDP